MTQSGTQPEQAQTGEKATEKEVKEQPALVAFGNRMLSFVEDGIYVGIAVVLGVGAMALLVVAAGRFLDLFSPDMGSEQAMVGVLDTILLVFIFVELLFGVRATLTERKIIAEPFLLVGILTAIKEIVVLAIRAAEEYVGTGPQFARAMTELGLLGGLVLLLAVSSVLLRAKEKQPAE